MPRNSMEEIEVTSVEVNPGSLFSKGIGKDKDGALVRFIGHTSYMAGLRAELGKLLPGERILIKLEKWQYDNQTHNKKTG